MENFKPGATRGLQFPQRKNLRLGDASGKWVYGGWASVLESGKRNGTRMTRIVRMIADEIEMRWTDVRWTIFVALTTLSF
ncbi:MAG: hypothetical protein WD357_07215 [Gracilimonas sp.]